MKKIIKFTLILCFSFVGSTLSFGNCEWYSVYCKGTMSEWQAYCVNVGGNTGVSCLCGLVVDCGNHGGQE